MSAGISAIATLSPIMASQFIFSSRRLDRGFEALQSDPMTAVMNFDIATAQCAKGSKAALDVAKTTSAEMKQVAQGISNTAKEVANSSKVLKGVSKVVDFTARNINPVICLTSGYQVLKSDDKKETLIDESAKLGTMFAGEGAYKVLAGMPRYNKKTKEMEQVTGLIEEIGFVKKGIDRFSKFCNEKVLFKGKLPLKFLPGTLKGLGFVATSIACYNLGDKLYTPD